MKGNLLVFTVGIILGSALTLSIHKSIQKSVPTAAVPVDVATTALPPSRESGAGKVCKDIIEKYCAGLSWGGRLGKCLISHENEATLECKSYIDLAKQIRLLEKKINQDL